MRASRTRAGIAILPPVIDRGLIVAVALLAGGCQSLEGTLRPVLPESVGNFVFREDKAEHDGTNARGAEQLNVAHEIYRGGNYDAAQTAFHKIAENTRNSPLVAEEARFYEAECLYKLDKLPKSCDTYHKMLVDFPSGAYRDQAVRRMFDIANYWLEDTRTEMAEYREKREGKRTMVVPAVFHTEKKKPLLDEEGRAVQALDQVHLNDVTGPLADKALFLAGGVKFYREDYREADHYFSMLVEQHKDSPLAPQAIELAIISKHMSTGGPEYDGRKVAEARLLVDSALRNYPELARDKSGFLERQLGSITYQQAQKDYLTGEFYRRTGKPGSAYFYYEIVRRRYPGSKFADLATERMNEIRKHVEESGDKSGSVFDQAKASIDRMFGKKPAEGGADPAQSPALLPQGPDPGAVPRSLPTNLGKPN
jgi:outer membrane protein assembly factor BamD (BamD/ComL family)